MEYVTSDDEDILHLLHYLHAMRSTPLNRHHHENAPLDVNVLFFVGVLVATVKESGH